MLSHLTHFSLSTMSTCLMEAADAVAGWALVFNIHTVTGHCPPVFSFNGHNLQLSPSPLASRGKKAVEEKNQTWNNFVQDLLIYMPILLAFWRGGVPSWTSSLNVMIFVPFAPTFRMITVLSDRCQFWDWLWYAVISLPFTQHCGYLSFFVLIFVKLKIFLLFHSLQV